MSTSVYKINKGINQSIEFKGLKAQYIWYLGGGVVVLLIVFSILYSLGFPSLFCVALVGGAGVLLVLKIYKFSNQYGAHGLMKKIANKQLPKSIRVRGRAVFSFGILE